MKGRVKLLGKVLGGLVVLLTVIGLLAPMLTADRYGQRLQANLSRALGRRVQIGKVHFNLFKGPGFSVDDVTIYEDPAIGLEPVVYIQEPGSLEVVPSIWSLLGGRFVIASIRLDGASITLTKSGPASEWGRWNFGVPSIELGVGRYPTYDRAQNTSFMKDQLTLIVSLRANGG